MPTRPRGSRSLVLAAAGLGTAAVWQSGGVRAILDASGPADGAWRLPLALVPLVFGLGWAPLRLLGWARGPAGFALAGTVAPLAWFLVASWTIALGFGFAEAARWALVTGTVLLLLVWLRARRRGIEPPEETSTFPATDTWALLAWTLFVAFCLMANPALFWRSDAWFHAAVTYRIDAVGLPADDPYFGGQPLGYFWGFHAALGLLAASARVDPFLAGAGWSLVAAATTGLWLLVLARRFGGSAAAAWVLPVAALALNPAGWWAWLGRGLVGESRGLDALASAVSGGAIAGLEAVSWRYPHPSVGYFFDKFLLVTAFGTGMAVLLAAGHCLRDRASVGRLAAAGRLALVVATGLVLHPIAGVTTAVAVGMALVLLSAQPLRRAGGLWLAVGLVGGLALTWPYLSQLSEARASSGWSLTFNGRMLWTWLASGGFLVALAGLALRARGADPELRLFAALPAATAILGLGLVLVPANETKFFQLGALALAVPAAVGWARLGPGAARRAATLLLFAGGLPTAALVTSGFLAERGQDVYGTFPLDSSERSAYQWLSEASAPRALVVAGDGETDRVPPDAPVYGRRALLWGGEGYARNWGYGSAELEVRRRLQRAAFHERPDSAAVQHLRDWTAAESPELLAWRSSGDADTVRMREVGWRAAWRSEDGAWWRWRP